MLAKCYSGAINGVAARMVVDLAGAKDVREEGISNAVSCRKLDSETNAFWV